jgi:phosphomevalonate kinase
MLRRTIVSAPGKVLITGGYLVLDPIYTGTVIATSARFYCVLTTQASIPANTIVVKSPQFLDALWTYDIRHASDQIQVEPSAGDRNKFVEIALRETFKVAQALVGVESVRNCLRDDSGAEMGLEVMIVGDNDFYSQRRSVRTRRVSSNPIHPLTIPLTT